MWAKPQEEIAIADSGTSRESMVDIPSAQRSAVRRKLLRWYDRNKRDLPWRRQQGDPYAQWVAEIMLQQTRVDTVIPYYVRFMRRFPSVVQLGEAKHSEVLKHWEGLGYYRRALYLHRAAQSLCKEKQRIPETSSTLQSLPGVGVYTAAAIASIAYGEHVAAVDGNVARVVSRLFGVSHDIQTRVGGQIIQHLADQLVPPSRPGDFNQAWMDLGSQVCKPAWPNCDQCPLLRDCDAMATGRVGELPVRKAGKVAVIPVKLVAVVFCRNGRKLVQKRDTGGLWSGLWEYPTSEREAGKKLDDLCIGLADEYEISLAGKPKPIGKLRHQLTHRSLSFEVLHCDVSDESVKRDRRKLRWATDAQFEKLSVSKAYRRIDDLYRTSSNKT